MELAQVLLVTARLVLVVLVMGAVLVLAQEAVERLAARRRRSPSTSSPRPRS